MTPERKKKLRVSDGHVTGIAFTTSSLSFRRVCLTTQCVYCANNANVLDIIYNGDGRYFLYFYGVFSILYIGKPRKSMLHVTQSKFISKLCGTM
jgi:hypothetical protein